MESLDRYFTEQWKKLNFYGSIFGNVVFDCRKMSNEIAQLAVRVVACNRVEISSMSSMSKIDNCEYQSQRNKYSCNKLSVNICIVWIYNLFKYIEIKEWKNFYSIKK